jgi:hypothetical protein
MLNATSPPRSPRQFLKANLTRSPAAGVTTFDGRPALAAMLAPTS